MARLMPMLRLIDAQGLVGHQFQGLLGRGLSLHMQDRIQGNLLHDCAQAGQPALDARQDFMPCFVIAC